MKVIDRISINGKRYIASEDRAVLDSLCEKKGINKKWIRFSERHWKYYLRLWGRWMGV